MCFRPTNAARAIPCLECGSYNKPENEVCQKCGADMKPSREAAEAGVPTPGAPSRQTGGGAPPSAPASPSIPPNAPKVPGGPKPPEKS